jgi:hydrogenase 3 maturation protease
MKTQRPSHDTYGLGTVLRSAHSLAVVGIGSDLRGDDIAGCLVLRELRVATARSRPKKIRLFDGGTAPENLTGAIGRFRPSHILLVDAADLGEKPGAVKLIEPENIDGMSFSTHALPLSIMADYLERALPCRVLFLGIQPGRTDFGAPPSREIRQTARRLARIILNAAPGRQAKRQRGKGQAEKRRRTSDDR